MQFLSYRWLLGEFVKVSIIYFMKHPEFWSTFLIFNFSGETLCFVTSAFRYVNAFADWMSLGMIALSRCVSLTKPDLGERLFSGRNGKLIILMVWIYANLLVVPVYFGVSYEWNLSFIVHTLIRFLYFRVLALLGIIVTMANVTSYLRIGPMFIPGYFCMELGSQYHVSLPLLVMVLFGGMFGVMTSIWKTWLEGMSFRILYFERIS